MLVSSIISEGFDNFSESRNSKSADQKLWDDFRTGSEGAYALIYQQHFFSLYQYGLKICSEKEIVKDCIQDLFIYIWKNKDRLKETNSIKFYLFTALKRRLIDNYTSQSKLNNLEDINESRSLETVSSEETRLIADQIVDEKKHQVLMALEKLTSRQKEAVVLKFYDNLPNEDIASRMDISVEGVYNLISKALGRFRKDLSKAYYTILSMLPFIYYLF